LLGDYVNFNSFPELSTTAIKIKQFASEGCHARKFNLQKFTVQIPYQYSNLILTHNVSS